MIFVDLNGNPFEHQQMIKSACERGETLKVLPTNYDKIVKLTSDLTRIKNDSYTICKKRGIRSKACSKSESDIKAVEKKVNDIKNKSQLPNRDGLEKLVADISKGNAKITHLNFSGHDGGGNFGGAISAIGKEEVGEIFQKFPEQRDSVQSLLLLGCYTGVTAEIREWRDRFPKAKLIAGYDGKGPLGDRLAGHTYIRDILKKEQSIVREAEEKKLYSLLNNGIEHIRMLSAAIYVEPFCASDNPSSYYFRASKQGKQRFRSFDDTGCLKIIHKASEMRLRVTPYVTGEKDIPTNTSSSEMRELYNFARENSHCFTKAEPSTEETADEVPQSEESDHPMGNPDQLMMLLFYHQFKINFARYYKDELAEMEKMIDQFDPTELLEKNTREIVDAARMLELQVGYQKALGKSDGMKFLNSSMKSLRKQIFDVVGDDEKMKKLIEISVFKEEDLTAEDQELLRNNSVDDRLMAKLSSDFSIYQQMRFYKQMEMTPDEKRDYINETVSAGKSDLERLESKTHRLATLKDDLKEKFWVPNEKNIKDKSRKEILDNLTVLNELLGEVQSYETKDTIGMLTIAKNNMETLLNYRDEAPFTWHEISDVPEAPARIAKLFEESTASLIGTSFADGEQDPQDYE